MLSTAGCSAATLPVVDIACAEHHASPLDLQGTKRVRDSNSPEEREDSPAARPPLGGGRGGGGRGRGRGGGRPKLKPQPAAAPLPPGYKPMLAPNHHLSSRAILPPHGRGRAPKVTNSGIVLPIICGDL